MPSTMHRTQILLEPYQHRALKKLARQQERSVSDLIRQIVSIYLTEVEQQSQWAQRATVVGKLAAIRQTGTGTVSATPTRHPRKLSKKSGSLDKGKA